MEFMAKPLRSDRVRGHCVLVFSDLDDGDLEYFRRWRAAELEHRAAVQEAFRAEREKAYPARCPGAGYVLLDVS